MLDRSKLMRELENVSSRLFIDISGEFDLARAVWQSIVINQSFLAAVTEADFHAPLPLWQGELGKQFPLIRTEFAQARWLRLMGHKFIQIGTKDLPAF